MPTGKNDNPNNSTRYNPKGWKSAGSGVKVAFPQKGNVLRTVAPNGQSSSQLQTVLPDGPASGGGAPLQVFPFKTQKPLQTALPNAPASGGGSPLQTVLPAGPRSGIKPSEMTNDYVGEPVNNSYSDTLRSMEPVQLGSGDVNTSYSDMLRSLAAGGTYPAPTGTPATSPAAGNGGYGGWSFGTRYKGWGGGGNYNGGGGDYGGNPWINYMLGLNNWQI